jgi:hypothetical protein
MKYATVEDIIASFPHPVLPTVQDEPDYQTIHAIWKSLQEKSRAIDIHLGGGTLGHLGLIEAAQISAARHVWEEDVQTIAHTPPCNRL